MACNHDFLLHCPSCGAGLCASCGSCSACSWATPLSQGVLSFLSQDHPFYEGAYRAQIHFPLERAVRWPGSWILPFINYGYLSTILRHAPQGGRLLELGCGGGARLLGQRYQVTAADLSRASLEGTPAEYAHRIQGDALEIEFQGETFDAIAASFVWEHFTPEQKARLAEKFAKWLKPGGRLVLLFDTESQNPCFRWFRKDEKLYQRCFVENDGHVGLESPEANKTLLREAGFSLIAGRGLNRTVQHLPVYTWILPYGERFWPLKALYKASMIISSSAILNRLFTGALHLWDLSLGRAFPESWSRLYIGVWQKGRATE